MGDAKDIETAYRLIEGYVGEGDPPEPGVRLGEFLAEMGDWEPEVLYELRDCGQWAIKVAWDRYRGIDQ